MKYDQEVYEALAENERIALTEEIMKIGDALGLKTTSSDYNAIKVMQVIRQLIDASLVASKPPKKKPLKDELVRDIQAMCHLKNVGYDTFIMRFARAIERAHGIGE